MRLIIIGGVAAGTKAAAKAHRTNPDLEIILYQDGGCSKESVSFKLRKDSDCD